MEARRIAGFRALQRQQGQQALAWRCVRQRLKGVVLRQLLGLVQVAPQAAVVRALARRQMPALEWELVLVVLMQLALVRVLLVLLLLVLGPVQAQLQLFDQARGQLVSQVQQL